MSFDPATYGLISQIDAAARLKVSKSRVKQLLQAGKLTGPSIAGRRAVDLRSLDSLIAARSQVKP